MKTITVHDKTFRLAVPEADITAAVSRLAAQIEADYGERNPLFVVVLSGAFVFASDLLRHVRYPADVAFTKLASYAGTQSTGHIVQQLPTTAEVLGRHVVIVEDIVERGYSMHYLLQELAKHQPASIEICALTAKPQRYDVPGLTVKYVGMTLPDAFIVGYGLDYNGAGRLLRDIYQLVE